MTARHHGLFRVLLPIFLLVLAGSSAWWILRRSTRQPAEVLPTVEVYFHGTGTPEGPPVAARRQAALSDRSATSLLREAVRALLAGPTKAEKDRGLFSSFPPGTKLLGVRVARPFATINLGRALETTGGTARVSALLDELTYTAASIKGIKGVILEIAGERAGTAEHPFTGEGFLFGNLHPPVDGAWARGLGPADALDLFIVVIPRTDVMWKMMGPKARRAYGTPEGIEFSAFAEGLGSWRNYQVESERIRDGEAVVVIAGSQVLEGNEEPNARYEGLLVKEDGRWKWDLP